jgi:catechol 2,3-dioxygenase-like lactoylglutathione lyase family enzyme
MAGEVTAPLLPCADVDEIAAFYAVLGFERAYRQLRPNPYVALRREDLHLHFFGIPGFDPAESYGSCLVQVPDVGALFEAFAAGIRAAHGNLLVKGLPRMTRPRVRKNMGGLTGFSVVDPGGNWIRIIPLAGSRRRPRPQNWARRWRTPSSRPIPGATSSRR